MPWDRMTVDAGRVEEYYVKHADALVRFAASQVGPSDAEDLVATVITSLLRNSSAEPLDVRAYLYRSVANASRQHWRTLDRRARREAMNAPMDRYEHHEFIPEVVRAL